MMVPPAHPAVAMFISPVTSSDADGSPAHVGAGRFDGARVTHAAVSAPCSHHPAQGWIVTWPVGLHSWRLLPLQLVATAGLHCSHSIWPASQANAHATSFSPMLSGLQYTAVWVSRQRRNALAVQRSASAVRKASIGAASAWRTPASILGVPPGSTHSPCLHS